MSFLFHLNDKKHHTQALEGITAKHRKYTTDIKLMALLKMQTANQTPWSLALFCAVIMGRPALTGVI